MQTKKITLTHNTEVLQHIMQNNLAPHPSNEVAIFEQRVYDYLMIGLAGIQPSSLEELARILPEELSEAEKL